MIKLYKCAVIIELGRSGHGGKTENMPMSQSDFSVHKGGMVNIDFVVRNADRKPINLTGKALTMVIMDRHNGKVLMRKPMNIGDPLKGLAIVSFTPVDFKDFDVKSYRYSVMMADEDGLPEFLYLSQHQTATGYVDVRGETVPAIVDSTIINMSAEKTTPINHSDRVDNAGRTRWMTGPYPVGDGITTIAVYVTKYHGKLWVQGSLNNSADSANDQWFDLDLGSGHSYWEFTGQCGIESFNFTEKMKWIRFVVEPYDTLNGVIHHEVGAARKEGDGRLTQILLRT